MTGYSIILTVHCLSTQNALEESKVRTKHGSTCQHNVSGSVDTRNGQLLTKVPHQVSDTVESVESKWKSHGGLGKHLGSHRQSSKCRHDGGGVKWNRQKRGGSITTSQGVERTSHGNTGDSVERGQVPGELWLVDGQVWGNRTVLSLGDENLIFLLVRNLDGGAESDSQRSTSGQWGEGSKG